MLNKKIQKKMSVIIILIIMVFLLVACSNTSGSNINETTTELITNTEEKNENLNSNNEINTKETTNNTEKIVATASTTANGLIDITDMFTNRDLEQTADLSEAKYIEIKEKEDIIISTAGIYVISGSANEVTIYIETNNDDKVQIVLDKVNITNKTKPTIYIKSADKVFITTTDSTNSLEVTESFETDGDTNLDAVIFSKADLVINGLGILNIQSTDNAITSKDTLKITDGTLNISCTKNAIEAHDAIEIADGTINITECHDGIHAEDNDNDTAGYIYICSGTINIIAEDDAIHGTTIVQIDNGNITLNAAECIEGTYIQINGGNIDIEASDDGINATYKSKSYTPTFEINDGTVTINMGPGDTDGIDSNGNIYVNGGTIDINGQSAFDYDGNAEYKGGTIIENETTTNTITNQFFGNNMNDNHDNKIGIPDDKKDFPH